MIKPVEHLQHGTRSGRSAAHRQAGMAMALVLIAVGIAVMMGATFLATSTSATATVQIMADYNRARYIAESGVDQTFSYIQNSATWRTDRTEGDWIVNQSFGGGTYTVNVVDGIDEDNDGVINGDNDLSDSGRDPITVTVTATYGDGSYRLQAAWSPGGGSTIAASEKIELKNNGVVDSYSTRVGAYGGTNVGSNAIISCNAVGDENIIIKDHAAINGNVLFPDGGDPTLALADSSSIGITGSLGTLANTISLDEPNLPTIASQQGDLKYDSGDVEIINADIWCNKLEINGDTVFKVDGDVSIIVEGDFKIKDKAQIRLTNPSFGNTTQHNNKEKNVQQIQIASPVTIGQAMSVTSLTAYISKKDKKVRYAIYTDSSGEPGTLLAETEQVKMTESNGWLEIPLDAPVAVSAGTYWLALSFEDKDQEYYYDTTGSMRHRTYNAYGNGFLASWGTSDASYTRLLDMYLSANVAGQGASLTIYCYGQVSFEGSSTLNADTQDPSRFTFWHLNDAADAKMEIDGSSITYGTINALYSEFKIKDDAVVNGRGWVYDLKLEKNAVLNVDSSGGAADPGFVIDNLAELKNDININGYDGTLNLAFNSIGTPVITIKDQATLKGDAYGGPGGSGGNTFVRIDSGASMTGSTGNLVEAVDITLPTFPSLFGSAHDLKVEKGTVTVTEDMNVKKIEVKEDGILVIDGQVQMVVTEDSKFEKNAKLTLTSGSTLTIYTEKKFEFKDDAEINLDGDPANLIFYSGKDKIELTGRTQMAATTTAPIAEVKVKDDSQYYGSILARKIKVEKNGQIHYDAASESSIRWMTQPRL